MDFNFKRKRLDTFTNEQMLDELEKAAKHFNYIEFGWRDFNKVANISANPIKKHFGSWKKGLEILKQHLQQLILALNCIWIISSLFLRVVKARLKIYKHYAKNVILEKVIMKKLGKTSLNTAYTVSLPLVASPKYFALQICRNVNSQSPPFSHFLEILKIHFVDIHLPSAKPKNR